MKTILYIDGFNFYYGARRFGIRWVDPRAIAKVLLPDHEIVRIRYFSALIKPDPLGPIRIVRQRFKKTVGLLNPQKRLSYALQPEVDFYKQIRRGVLEACLFPDSLTDRQGTFHKPHTW